MAKERYEISAMFQAAVYEALEAGMTEQEIREELDAALGSAWPE